MNEESSIRREGFRKNARGTQLGLFDKKPEDSDNKKTSSQGSDQPVVLDLIDEQDEDGKQ
mgnify:CR=1 FL=1|tara:strand:- start:102 stop:281 length:180 start_codon:yes stop_codon:yes gene_type:complete